ncbi:putative cytochrome P450 [Xylariaceae sp. FL1272]|nr:putative cytochrome P450 [Xylariaceae sp. FL1272]
MALDHSTLLIFCVGFATAAYFATQKMVSRLLYIGHLIGMSRGKFNYLCPSQSVKAPIFTMPLPGQKMYVVPKPDLVLAVQKQHRTLAFLPVEAKFASTVCGVSQEAQAILAKNINLYEWLRIVITTATTRSVYGPMNPYEDPNIIDAFWHFENGFMSILVSLLPSLVARKPLRARTKVVHAFAKYYKAGAIRQASALTQKRYQVDVDNNVTLEDIARYEVGGSIAVLVNTAPAAFWTLLLINSYPGLLDDLDITTLKERCPLLLSSCQEVLRYRSMGTSVRQVMEDTDLDQWLLVIHQDGYIWGDDVDGFNPRRFLQRQRHACFRPFGGGKTLCPGRHFATNEILAVVATFVSRFDMKPARGSWTLPTAMNTNIAAVVMQPDHDIEVDITVRRESEAIFALVTEDHDETA